jgi:NTP pyrophosphatase (non-canonical NTP hydrolase)
MDFNEYQDKCRKTAFYAHGKEGLKVLYPTLGLTGESGEVAEKVKKLYRDKNGVIDDEFITNIKKELGDVMWYIAALCSDLNLRMEDVAKENIEKLLDRKSRGVLHGDGDNR